ncbi:DUF3710 domain-containing protein [Streptomyces sp. NPDC047315]|uniref:DUF3710 domain-containing protein n=1 Tax=Streptomyces sp. NPDC047315 TaxID=3155142 RepID=UPI0033DBEBB9
MTHRPAGPWDISELPDPDPAEERVDLGGLLVPVSGVVEVRVDLVGEVPVAATVILGGSSVQLQAFAAPEDGGWEDIRGRIVRGIVDQGGTAEESPGTFGPEVRARMYEEAHDGAGSWQEIRFAGVDGPGWVLRGVFYGLIARRPGRLAGPLAETFRRTVVVLPGYPMEPDEAIPLRLPDVATAEPAEDPDSERPFPRPRTRPRLPPRFRVRRPRA